jgi:branched-chain amino acid transport system substrate-binding protein
MASLAASACANSHGGDSAPSTSPGPKLTGAPVNVGTIGEITGVGLNWPFQRAVVEAAARGINARGGIDGRPVVVHFCDGQNDPDSELQCARDLVSQGVAAVIGGITVYDSAAVDELFLQHEIAVIGSFPLAAADFNLPNMFQLGAAQFGIYSADVYNASLKGLKKLWIMNSNTPGIDLVDRVSRDTAAAHGIEVLGNSVIATTATNDAPYVQASLSAGADSVMPSMGASQTAAVLLALNQVGAKVTLMNLDTEPAGNLQAVCGPGGGVCTGSLGSSFALPPTYTANAGVRLFHQDMEAQAKTGDTSATPAAAYNDLAAMGWLAMHAFAVIAQSQKAITAESIYNGFKAAKNIDMYGMMPPWTPNASVGIPGYPRISQKYVYLTELHSDLLPYATGAKPYDITKLNPMTLHGG